MNLMKSIPLAIALTGSVLFTSSIALAGDYVSAAGAALTLGTTGAGADPATLVFQPSPGVSMNAYTAASAFAINAMNTVAADGNRNEYLVLSTKAGYYQKALSGTTGITDLTAVTQAVTGYTYQGGGS